MCVGLLLQAAMCYIHIAALIAEYLKRKGMINISKTNCISINIIVQNHSWLSLFPSLYVKYS